MISEEKKNNVVLTPEEFGLEVSKRIKSKSIIIWDDAGLWLHAPDTKEKIKEDFIKLCVEYKEALNSPDLFFTSSYSALREMHIRTVFLIQVVALFKRIERLGNQEAKK